MLKSRPELLITVIVLFVIADKSISAEDDILGQDKLARIATAHRLAAESQNVQQSLPALSLLLAVEALRVTMDHGEPPVTTAHSALRSALMNTGGRSLGSRIMSVSISADSRWLVTDDQLWDLAADHPTAAPFTLTGHMERLQSVMFHPDSQRLVTVSSDCLLLWDLTGTEPKASLLTARGPEMWWSESFSPNGRWLAASGYNENDKDRFIRLWDFKSEQPGDSAVDLRGHKEPINITSFSPNGRWLATADENVICLWDLQAEGSIRPAHVLTRHDEQLTSLLWSRDGRWMLTANRRRSILWNLTDKEPVALELNTESYSDLEIDFSQDSRWLLMVTKERRLRLWDLSLENPRASMRELGDFPRSGYDAVWQPLFSADSRWVVASTFAGNVVYLWDLKAAVPHEARYVLERPQQMIGDIAIDPQSRWIATAEVDGRVRIWDLRSRNPLSLAHVLPGHQQQVKSLSVSDDGELILSSGKDGTLRAWKPNSSQPAVPVAILRGHEGTPQIAAISPDNRWLVTQSSDGARLWDLTAPDQTLSPLILPIDRKMDGVQFFSDQDQHKLAICGVYNPVVLLCDLDGPHPTVRELGRLDKQIQVKTISPDKRWLAVGSRIATNGMLWDLWADDPAARPYLLVGHHRGIKKLLFSPDSRWLVTTGTTPWDGTRPSLLLWNLQAKDPTAIPTELPGGERSILDPVFGPDGRWLLISNGSKSRLWDLRTEDPQQNPIQLGGHQGKISQHGISDDGHWAYTLENKRLRIWDLMSPKPGSSAILLGSSDAGAIRDIEFTHDSRWIVTSNGKTNVQLWDLESESITQSSVQLSDFSHGLSSAAFSSDGRWLAATDKDGGTRLLDLSSSESARKQMILSIPDHRVRRRVFSPDNRWLLTVGLNDKHPRLWNIQQEDPAEAPLALPGHIRRVYEFAFSDDGRWLATSDGVTAQVWDLRAKQFTHFPLRFQVPRESPAHLSFSPDNSTLICGYSSGTVRLWPLDLHELINLAVHHAGRALTDEECNVYDIPKTAED